MKKYVPKISLFIIVCLSIIKCAQAQDVPRGFNYQAIARDASGKALVDQSIRLKINLLEGAATGTVVYEETHQLTTDAFGLFTLTIGQGSPLSGTFDNIAWGNGSKFLQVSMDPEGSDNFIEMGTTQLLSVPYALYAEKSGDTLPPPKFHPGNGIAIVNDSLTNTGDTDASDDLTITSEATGDVQGKFSELKVEKLQGSKLDIPDSIGDGTVLKWDGAQWKPGRDSTVWNNQDSLIFYPKGRVGIGTTDPKAWLHIDRIRVPQDDTFVFPMLRLTTTDTASATMGGTGTSGISMGAFGSETFITSNKSGTFSIGSDAKEQSSLSFLTGGEKQMFIDAEGKVGIGINTPNYLHHVHARQKDTHGYNSFTQYTSEETGTEVDDGLIVGMIDNLARIENRETGSLVITTGGTLFFGSGDIWPRVRIERNGNVGIGLASPATHELHLKHASSGGGGAAAGIKIENEGRNNNWWGLYTANGSGQFELYYRGSFRGFFDPDDGEYKQASDGRLKHSITPLPPALNKVLQLKPSTYYFKDDGNLTTPSLGFIAQEVQPLFPELVGYAGEEQDIMTLNYNGFSVLAIKAIQEQQALIKTLTEEVVILKNELNTLKNQLP